MNVSVAVKRTGEVETNYEDRTYVKRVKVRKHIKAKVFKLELNEDEAKIIAALTGNIGGSQTPLGLLATEIYKNVSTALGIATGQGNFSRIHDKLGNPFPDINEAVKSLPALDSAAVKPVKHSSSGCGSN